MSQNTDHFCNELEKLIFRFRKEYDITLAEVVGCLEIQKHVLIEEAMDDES